MTKKQKKIKCLGCEITGHTRYFDSPDEEYLHQIFIHNMPANFPINTPKKITLSTKALDKIRLEVFNKK